MHKNYTNILWICTKNILCLHTLIPKITSQVHGEFISFVFRLLLRAQKCRKHFDFCLTEFYFIGENWIISCRMNQIICVKWEKNPPTVHKYCIQFRYTSHMLAVMKQLYVIYWIWTAEKEHFGLKIVCLVKRKKAAKWNSLI